MIGYISKEDNYIAASTDDIDSITRYDGTKLYLYDTKETKISIGNQWYPYEISTTGGGGGSTVIENGSITTEMFAETAKAPLAIKADEATTVIGATTTGLAVLKATNASAARTAIGAGTSNLTIGTTSSTAKAGDYQPAWSEVTDKPSTFTPVTATTSIVGGVKQAIAQDDSTATTIEELLTDFNVLLANLRSAGIIDS